MTTPSNIITFPTHRTQKYISDKLENILIQFSVGHYNYETAMNEAKEVLTSREELNKFEDKLFDTIFPY